MRDLPPRLTDAELATQPSDDRLFARAYEDTRECIASLQACLVRGAPRYHTIATTARLQAKSEGV